MNSSPHYPHERPPFVCWLYGLSGAGKSTISSGVAERLRKEHRNVVVLDGDDLRDGLCHDLGFTREDRFENVRRTAELAKLLMSQNVIVLVALMTPEEDMRYLAREIVGGARFLDVYVKCHFSLCADRDPKGLYRRLAAGSLTQFVGRDFPFEEPTSPGLVIDTAELSVHASVNRLLARLNAELPNPVVNTSSAAARPTG